MDQGLSSFEKLDPLSPYLRFKKFISQIKDKNTLLKISELLEERLNDFDELK